jgi:hypothetical protein
MAQELIRLMAGLYRTEREALLFTQPFGIDPLGVTPSLAPLHLWHELLVRLAAQGTVRAAVKAARDQFPKNPRADFLEALLADRQAPSSAEPFPEDGPGFDDTVREPEALLFLDDLTMPVGKVPNLIATLTKMIEAAPSVCLLRVDSLKGSFFGTGFRISPDLVLTLQRVIRLVGIGPPNTESAGGLRDVILGWAKTTPSIEAFVPPENATPQDIASALQYLIGSRLPDPETAFRLASWLRQHATPTSNQVPMPQTAASKGGSAEQAPPALM